MGPYFMSTACLAAIQPDDVHGVLIWACKSKRTLHIYDDSIQFFLLNFFKIDCAQFSIGWSLIPQGHIAAPWPYHAHMILGVCGLEYVFVLCRSCLVL